MAHGRKRCVSYGESDNPGQPSTTTTNTITGSSASRTTDEDDMQERRVTSPAGKTLLEQVPTPVLLAASEWLAVVDLFTLGTVDHSFRGLMEEEKLWIAAANHLWKSALLADGHGLGVVEDADLAETGPWNVNLALQDICRCMVGAWPTYIDLDSQEDRFLQASVDGVLQPFLPAGCSRSSSKSAGAAPNSGSGSATSTLPVGHATGVVFRGRIGGDRAVRANVPFPWMGSLDWVDSTKFRPTREDLSIRCTIMTSLSDSLDEPTPTQYPDVVLARVKTDAPFAFLWPGHVDGRKRVGGGGDATAAASTAASAAADGDHGGTSNGGSSGDTGGGALAAASGCDQTQSPPQDFEQAPTSGPTPFFHAGYTAYFEITLGRAVAPLNQPHEEELFFDQCVAIGLANDGFSLAGKQPGWDRRSWGFHSDDGGFHHQCCISGNHTTFGIGDTVGCGLLYPRGCATRRRRVSGHRVAWPTEVTVGGSGQGAIFFTKNGRFLGVAFQSVNVKRPLYPCIGLDSHCLVTANFGSKAFAFDVPTFEALFEYTAHSSEAVDDHKTAIREAYSRGKGFVNPRLIHPHFRLLTVADEDQEVEGDAIVARKGGSSAGRGTLHFQEQGHGESESKILRRSLTRFRRGLAKARSHRW